MCELREYKRLFMCDGIEEYAMVHLWKPEDTSCPSLAFCMLEIGSPCQCVSQVALKFLEIPVSVSHRFLEVCWYCNVLCYSIDSGDLK